MEVISAESTELFVGPPEAPVQLARVSYRGADRPAPVRIDGDGLTGQAVTDGPDGTVEVPVHVERSVPGQQRSARVAAAGGETTFGFTVAEPGWTMFMVGHFHYDPVWWNTQANYTSAWTEDPPGACRQTNGIDLVRRHLEWARREPEYKFVLAELDYLKPYWDTHPQDRAELRQLLRDGRVEVMGGSYNEPSTTLTNAETTIRNLVHGIGFQRDVVGAEPATGWQLDVFGHDPQYPGMIADAGLTSSAWARGPHHQWGPMASQNGVAGDPQRMQFASEFEWIAPSGRGVLTHYMPAHYAAGWWMDSAESLADAEDAVYRLFCGLRRVAATRNVLLPVGTDFTPPNRWLTAIHRDWAARYTWPKFVCALPREFFAAVRAELAERQQMPSPQTRDMNPIYTGCPVSYIDVKQANRAAEHAVLAGERFALFAALLSGARYPQAALTKAWAQLAYGAHHDAVTGSSSDQVYLDLLTGWRDAWQLGCAARDNALAVLSGAVAGDARVAENVVAVWNPVAHDRTDVVIVHLDTPPDGALRVVDADGAELPAQVDDGGHTISWLAREVPSLGWRTYRLGPGTPAGNGRSAGWAPVPGARIGNEAHRITVDAARGGGVSSWLRHGRELIAAGAVGNELAVYEEYPRHPSSGEGPWHLVPSGRVDTSATATDAHVQAYRGPLGERLVVRGRVQGRFGPVLAYTQTLTLWRGVDRVDCRTTVDELTGADQLLRLRWPCPVPGAMPVAEVGDAVIGRGFGLLHDEHGRSVDTASRPWTLDTAAHRWFGLSSAARVRIGAATRAVSVAEVVGTATAATRELMVALVRAGVTATCSAAAGPRYGDLAVDSNLPDARIALGGPAANAFTRAVLADADPCYAAELDRQLAETGRGRVWVPAAAPLAAVWRPGADLRSPRALPVLVVAAADHGLQREVAALAADLADNEIVVDQRVPAGMAPFEARTVALLNRGVPSFAVDTAGTLHTSLLRCCSSWPSAAWIDEPRRTAPDGSPFQLMHWTHRFDYALIAADGDWRQAEIPSRAAEFAEPLLGVPVTRPAGGLPGSGSLLRIDSPGAVHLAAVKPAGNPLAAGSSAAVDPAAVALRLVETRGTDAAVAVSSEVASVGDLGRADLLEQPCAGDAATLRGYEIGTRLARLQAARLLHTDMALAPDAEATQPLYARYWLHNRGPAPLGGLPAVAHLHPQRSTAAAGEQVRLRLSVASDSTDTALTGQVTLICPDGWSAAPGELPVELAPGGHAESDVAVTAPPDAAPGLYPVRARLRLTGDLPPSWHQPVEDVALVSVGDTAGARLLYLVDGPADVTLIAGATARLAVTVGTDAFADLPVEAHLISPWGTWEWTGPAVAGAVLPARGRVELGFEVAPPAWAAPGSWWALIRVSCAGALVYSPAVRVAVHADRLEAGLH